MLGLVSCILLMIFFFNLLQVLGKKKTTVVEQNIITNYIGIPTYIAFDSLCFGYGFFLSDDHFPLKLVVNIKKKF